VYKRQAKNIIQFAYGEDYLDVRKLESVKFPTVLCSTADFEKFLRPEFPEYNAALTADREKYRRLFLAFERLNIKELISDEKKIGANVAKIVADLRVDYTAEKTQLADMVAAVTEFIELLPYVFTNEAYARVRGYLPDVMREACFLVQMQVRVCLRPAALDGVDMKLLRLMFAQITLRYKQALIDPGTAVGIIAAQCFSEPLTQRIISAHHYSALGGTKTDVLTVTKEVSGAKDVESLKNAAMYIPLTVGDRAAALRIANNIEMMKLRQFVNHVKIFYEKFGAPVHPDYKGEVADIRAFVAANPLLKPPANLTNWCLRFEINKTTLILKNMPLERIVFGIKEAYPDTYLAYSLENSSKSFLRVYFNNNLLKNTSRGVVDEFRDQLLDLIIRGIAGIGSTTVVESQRNEIKPDGSIGRVKGSYAIHTDGTNLAGVLTFPGVDSANVLTDAIQEVYDVLGIEAARQRIISAYRGIVDATATRHLLIYADEMTYTGLFTSIGSTGVKTRETSNVLLRMGFAAPLGVLEEAAVNGIEDTVGGMTAQFLVGSVPRHGTLYNSFYVNKQAVMAAAAARPDVLADILG
jgi:DNA-directed RNA polymerase II subunit RPB1